MWLWERIPNFSKAGKSIWPFHLLPASSLNERKVALLVRLDWQHMAMALLRDMGQMARMHAHHAVYQIKNTGERNIPNIFMEGTELFQRGITQYYLHMVIR